MNFDALKENLDREFSAEAIADWKDVVRFFINVTPSENFKILKDYIELCLANGAKPVGVVHPFFAATKGAYSKKLLREFRAMIAKLATDYDFACVDMFDLDRWTFDCFCDMTHLNSKGSFCANSLLAMKLLDENLIPVENFCDMTYEYFDNLSTIAPKDDYNAFLEKIFSTSAKMISRKKKIRVGRLPSGRATIYIISLPMMSVSSRRFFFAYRSLNRTMKLPKVPFCAASSNLNRTA